MVSTVWLHRRGWATSARTSDLFVNTFTYLMCNADLSEVSVLGFLWAWGRERTSPWSDKRYWTSSGRGDGIVRGGTGRIADRLGEILGSKAETAAKVVGARTVGSRFADHIRHTDRD